MQQEWQIVDSTGEVVMTAESVSRAAARERKSPKLIAEREAQLLVNVEAGDAPIFAVQLN